MGPGDHKAFGVIAWTAPVYFVLFAVARNYLETKVLAAYPMYSYYRGLHHISWFIATALVFVMIVQALTRTEPRKLMFMLFGVTFMGLPLLHSLATGAPLELVYLKGGVNSILRDIATCCLCNPKNRPLSLEMILLVTGTGGLVWMISGSKARGLGAFAVSYLALNAAAIHWVGIPGVSWGLFSVNTEYSVHPFQAIIYTYSATGMVIFTACRQGLFRDRGQAWKRSFGWGAAAWSLFVLWAYAAGRFAYLFDCLAAGLPLFTSLTIAVRLQHKGWRDKSSALGLLLLSALLFFQMLVMGPAYLGVQEHLTGPAAVRWIITPVAG